MDENKIKEEEIKLCEKCGSQLTEEEGKWICPTCDTEIDYFGDDKES